MRDHSVWQQQEEAHTAAPPPHLSEPLLPGAQQAEAKSGALHSRDWWARFVLKKSGGYTLGCIFPWSWSPWGGGRRWESGTRPHVGGKRVLLAQ